MMPVWYENLLRRAYMEKDVKAIVKLNKDWFKFLREQDKLDRIKD